MPTQCGEMRPKCAIALVERSSLVSLIRAYLSLLVIFPCTKQGAQREFTADESLIAKSVHISRDKYRVLSRDPTRSVESMSGDELNLILLPQFLSRISNDSASGNALHKLLRLVQKYPLLEYDDYKVDGLFSLQKHVSNVAANFPRVSVRLYTTRILLIINS